MMMMVVVVDMVVIMVVALTLCVLRHFEQIALE